MKHFNETTNLGLPYFCQGEEGEVVVGVVMGVQLVPSLVYWKLKVLEVFSSQPTF